MSKKSKTKAQEESTPSKSKLRGKTSQDAEIVADPEILLPSEDDAVDVVTNVSTPAAPIAIAAEDGTVSGTLSRAITLEQEGPVYDVGRADAVTKRGLSLPVSKSGSAVSRVGPLQAYMQTIGQYPVLSLEDERALAIRVFEEEDKQAAQALAVHNLRLVVKMAYKYRRAWSNTLDLIQEGNIGLLEAISRYNPYKGARFSTYAAFWIRAYLLRFILEHSRNVKVARTRAGRKLFFRLSKEREKLRALGIEPGPKLLAEKIGVSESDIHEVAPHLDQPEVRLDVPLSSDGDSKQTMMDLLSGGEASPESAVHEKAFAEDVGEAFRLFEKNLKDDRERAIFLEHMTAEDPLSLTVLGERFGVSKQRMGQIVSALKKRLKKHLLTTMGPDIQMHFEDKP